MALVLADRVKETTTTAGTGTVTLLGASTGFQSFAVIGNANTTYYTIAGQTTSEWEVGIGTYTLSGTTLARTTVLANSAGTQPTALTFSAGTKDVFVTYPSSKSVNLDASGNATALGTPVAFVGTNITGTASGLTAGNVTTNANLTGGVTSVGNAATVITNANLTGGVTSVGNAATVITNANLTGEATSVGNSTTLTNSAVIGKVLTGYVSGAGTVAATDSILQAIQKLNGNDATNANLTGAVTSSGNATSLGSFTSAQLLGALTDETGTGASVFATSPTINNPTVTNYVESVVAIGTVTTTNTIALTSGTVQTATLTASTACTFTMPTATAGKSFVLLLKQAAATGNGTATFTGVKFGTAGAPTITATAGKMDILTFIADGTNWYGSAAQGYTP